MNVFRIAAALLMVGLAVTAGSGVAEAGRDDARQDDGICNSYGCSDFGACNSYGCPKGPDGGCNSHGCWTYGGGCNSYGCWHSPQGVCNSYGCSEFGSCNSYGCPKAPSDRKVIPKWRGRWEGERYEGDAPFLESTLTCFKRGIELPDDAGGCNSYGCWERGGGCNSYGCWKDGGGCNSYGCWNSPSGSCNSYGCTEAGECNSYGCPRASRAEVVCRER